jgi:nucleoside-diphosphate-sugar epimerase
MNIEKFKSKKILVTGSSGFVGKNLVNELNNLGFRNI